MGAVPGGMLATAVSDRPSIATITLPSGIFGCAGSCGGPHTPYGKDGDRLSLANSLSSDAGPPSARRMSNRNAVSTSASCIGATPSAWLGVRARVRALPMWMRRTGTVLVSVISNSAKTSNGCAALPSAVPVSVGPPGPVPGVTEPLPVMAANARAVCGAASSRYLVTKASHVSGGRGSCVASPNSTSRSTGPTENRATPWNCGPSTMMLAPSDTEIVISPIHTSMVTPALICA